MTNYEKLQKAHGSFTSSDWVQNASVEIAEDWRENSQKIALKILRKIRLDGISQAELASRMNVSSQQISKWVKGKENFKLDTINKLEKVLGIKLIKVEQLSDKTEIPEIKYIFSKISTGIRIIPEDNSKIHNDFFITGITRTHGKNRFTKHSI